MSKRKLTGNERLFPKYGKTAQYNRYVRFIDMQNYVEGIGCGEDKSEQLIVRIEDDFADDVAAGLGGIVVGGLYHNAGEVRIRLPEVAPNFDVTADWSLTVDSLGNSAPVTDKNSFRQFLTDGYYGDNNLMNIVVTSFSLVGGRLKGFLQADGTFLDLEYLGITDVSGVGNVSSLTGLNLNNNQIVTFNPTIPLPSSLTELDLSSNQMTLTGYSASEPWATNLPIFTNPCTMYFNGNPYSITGTNLEAILLTKTVTIQA